MKRVFKKDCGVIVPGMYAVVLSGLMLPWPRRGIGEADRLDSIEVYPELIVQGWAVEVTKETSVADIIIDVNRGLEARLGVRIDVDTGNIATVVRDGRFIFYDTELDIDRVTLHPITEYEYPPGSITYPVISAIKTN